jgi:hypothetical protein
VAWTEIKQLQKYAHYFGNGLPQEKAKRLSELKAKNSRGQLAREEQSELTILEKEYQEILSRVNKIGLLQET